ncbi:MAG: hypothetical protein JWO47_364 [Candidatus Saccharibacteria bacterium]|nr:hypothetical protein [Candidatus Saccharibacteria bacterium]
MRTIDLTWVTSMHRLLDLFEADEVKDGEDILRGDLFHIGIIINEPEYLAVAAEGTKQDVASQFRKFIGFIETIICE